MRILLQCEGTWRTRERVECFGRVKVSRYWYGKKHTLRQGEDAWMSRGRDAGTIARQEEVYVVRQIHTGGEHSDLSREGADDRGCR